jgi:cell division protein FtsB
MWTHQRKRNNRGLYIIPAISLVVCAYFAHHSVDGRYGSEAREDIRAALVETQARLDLLRANRAALEHKVALLKVGTIERDTLDGFAREKLGLISANEVIFVQ